MINKLISELVQYGLNNNMVNKLDKTFVTNQLLGLFNLDGYNEVEVTEVREIHEILNDVLSYAIENNLVEDTTINKDLFDTKVMAMLTPMPSTVIKTFNELYNTDPVEATNYYYKLSQDTNYIRRDRIKKDEKWTVPTQYGDIDITINLSKPEKDPKDIAKAGQAKKSGYPACLLCRENEGYQGHFNHPGRGNHRIIPIKLNNEDYFVQYSPYVYYNEHCILLNAKHTPMKIDRRAFIKLLDFVRQFPHYMAGSNADLPIVGGSILSHDHFQGGKYVFAMQKAEYEETFTMKDYPTLKCGIIKWPMSVIRLQGTDINVIADASEYILNKWRDYTDEKAYIFSHTNGTPHNTITPIARKNTSGLFEIDLVLRNNITNEENPWGVYHPSVDLHHIKKENIGLIEVMGLAVLPARLKSELSLLEEYILTNKDIRSNDVLSKHADWVDEWIGNYEITSENIHSIVQYETGKVFEKVLECAGVYKRTVEGKEAFLRFIKTL